MEVQLTYSPKYCDLTNIQHRRQWCDHMHMNQLPSDAFMLSLREQSTGHPLSGMNDNYILYVYNYMCLD